MADQFIEDRITENVKRLYCCSYEALKEYHARMLAGITESAGDSAVYRGRIKNVETLEGLSGLPMTCWRDVEQAIEREGFDHVYMSKPVKFWQTSGYSGKPKKIFYGGRDIEGMYMSILEMLFVTGAFESDMSVWNMGVGEPYLPGTLFDDCFTKYKDSARIKADYVSEPATDEDGFVKSLKMISKVDGVNVLIAYPIMYYLISMSTGCPEWLEGKVSDAFRRLMVLPVRVLPASAGKAFAKFYLRKVDYRHIRHILETAKIGYVFGEPLGPYRVADQYPSITFYNILGSTELLLQAFQATPEVADLSVVLKNFIPEIASVEDVEAAKNDPEHRLAAVPWYEWKKGMRGELVITRPGECLPLIRYPTGDYIEVTDPARTVTVNRGGVRFDITLPAIRILSRTMDMVDFDAPDQSGAFFGFKFYSKNLSDAMERAGNVKWWEFYKLHGGPGRYMLRVIPENEVRDRDTDDFRKRIVAALLDENEDHSVSFSLAKELDALDIVIARPEAYEEIDRVIRQRIRQRQPLGRIKPRHIHTVASAEEYDRILKEKKERT